MPHDLGRGASPCPAAHRPDHWESRAGDGRALRSGHGGETFAGAVPGGQQAAAVVTQAPGAEAVDQRHPTDLTALQVDQAEETELLTMARDTCRRGLGPSQLCPRGDTLHTHTARNVAEATPTVGLMTSARRRTTTQRSLNDPIWPFTRSNGGHVLVGASNPPSMRTCSPSWHAHRCRKAGDRPAGSAPWSRGCCLGSWSRRVADTPPPSRIGTTPVCMWSTSPGSERAGNHGRTSADADVLNGARDSRWRCGGAGPLRP